ncbi:hypothetical protein [Phenylobacterium sp.]|uniref:hypothetical protein n=1 Tax=Phenylobacterium sp. TaxID=1871053 RepID=UPI00391DC0F6
MAQRQTDPALRPFCESGYEILDSDLGAGREAVIWSVDPLAPSLGDVFTVESRGVAHEAAVVQLAVFRGGRSEVCQVTDVF